MLLTIYFLYFVMYICFRYTYIYIYIYIYTHTYTHTHIYIHTKITQIAYIATYNKNNPELFTEIMKYIYICIYICISIYIYAYVYIYIYIYIYAYVYVCVYIYINLIEHNRHFLSTYFLFNPFKLPYWSYNIRQEFDDKPSIISYFPSTCCPTLGHHQVEDVLQKWCIFCMYITTL